MRKLERDPTAPDCLAQFKHGRDNWACVHTEHKTEIWQKLTSMQRGRCAYCEKTLSESFCHIEHFQQRSQFPKKTFDWGNLFGSCNYENSCGKHKDEKWSVDDNHAQLIKPDIDDPTEFLLFAENGTISPQPNLPTEKALRARETLRIFNLDAQGGALRRLREGRIIGPVQQFRESIEMLNAAPDLEAVIVAELQTVINESKAQEFSSAVLCVLKEMVTGYPIAQQLDFSPSI